MNKAPTLSEIWESINKILDVSVIGTTQLVFAGGAPRDELIGRTPRDFDLFLLDSMKNRGYLKRRVTDALQGFSVIEPQFPTDYKEQPLVTVNFASIPLQVIPTEAKTIEELLNQFDWNICRFAYDGRFHTGMNPQDITCGKTLELQNDHSKPLASLRRGLVFSDRYKMNIPRETLIHLCQRVIDFNALRVAREMGANVDDPGETYPELV